MAGLLDQRGRTTISAKTNIPVSEKKNYQLFDLVQFEETEINIHNFWHTVC